MVKAAFFTNNPDQIRRVYAEGRQNQLQSELDFFPEVITSENFERHLPELTQIEYIFSTWGMLQLDDEQISQLPSLKVVFYAAGSVQYFARPFLKKGILVVSGWAANAVPVAQMVVAQIILAVKGYYSAVRICKTSQGRNSYTNIYPGVFQNQIALLGAGMIGTKVIELLQPFEMQICVYDPFLSQNRAAQLGIKQVSLEEAFEQGFVVSNHIADLSETKGLLRRDLFARMQPYATFINTGRGATVDEEGMLDVLSLRQDLTVLLDVTYPEPPSADSRIFDLENVLLSPHIGSSVGREVLRQADYVIAEFHRFVEGEPLRYAVSLEMLRTMA